MRSACASERPLVDHQVDRPRLHGLKGPQMSGTNGRWLGHINQPSCPLQERLAPEASHDRRFDSLESINESSFQFTFLCLVFVHGACFQSCVGSLHREPRDRILGLGSIPRSFQASRRQTKPDFHPAAARKSRVRFSVTIGRGQHLFPSRTQQLRPGRQ